MGSVEHDGILPGFDAQILLAPDDGLAVVALANGARRGMHWLAPETAGLLRRMLDVPDPVVRTDVPHHPEIWGELVGWYGFSAHRTDPARLAIDDPEVVRAQAAVRADARTQALLDRIPDWAAGDRFGGHDSPRFAPNLLTLLFDHGVDAGDDPRIGRLLDQMCDHQDADGRFQSYASTRRDEAPVWGALLCDSHAILDVLVRAGRSGCPTVRAGLRRLAADLTDTAQGRAWPCLPHPVTGFHGPGRRGDFFRRSRWKDFASSPTCRRRIRLTSPVRTRFSGWPGSRCEPGPRGRRRSRTCSATARRSRP